jgi:hypothetical protein
VVGYGIAPAARRDARFAQVGTRKRNNSEDEMNAYMTHELVKIHQHELMAEAAHARLVKEARLAARGKGAPTRQPLIWLREAAGVFAARFATLTHAQVGSH